VLPFDKYSIITVKCKAPNWKVFGKHTSVYLHIFQNFYDPTKKINNLNDEWAKIQTGILCKRKHACPISCEKMLLLVVR
jgi:hypothetical protein